jgi:Rha family phage regulatory protein
MEELVYLKKDEMLTDSLKVAEIFQRRHDDVIKSVEKLIERNEEASKDNRIFSDISRQFIKTRYKDEQGRWQTKYMMNRDGFSLLVMGFTGKKAHEWKLKYIEAFNKMERIIMEKQTAVWLETRQQGKLIRKDETNIIQKLVEYAKEQGSTHADMLYMTYSKLANKMAGITNREQATILQLNDLSTMERIIAKVVLDGMEENVHYKEIYKQSKDRLETVTGWMRTAS